MTLFLSESDVETLLSPVDAVEAVEGSFRRLAAGSVHSAPRRRVPLEEGRLADMAASDLELGYAGVKAYAGFADGAVFAVALFSVERPELVALIEADRLGRLRTGAASAVAAKHLAREGATTLGVIGCGDQAETQVSASALQFRRSSASSPTAARNATCVLLQACRRRARREPPQGRRQDIVVTITTSRDPVLRGEWLQPGALVCAAGATIPPRASSTTSFSSAHRSSAAIRWRRRVSNPPI